MSKFDKNLKSLALRHAEALIFKIFPNARREGKYVVLGSTDGETGRSLKIDPKTGYWNDFAEPGQKGGTDVITLLMAASGLDFQAASNRVRAELKSISIEVLGGTKAASAQLIESAIVPVPDDVALPKLVIGQPYPAKPSFRLQQWWIYRDGDGKPVLCVVRYQSDQQKPNGKFVKIILPLSYFGKDKGWLHKGTGLPKNPLFNLAELNASPEKPVLIVEGEKACDAAAALFPDHIAMCWLGGTGQIGKADFSPLARRAVTYWPDADKPGEKTIPVIIDMLRAAGVTSLKIVPLPATLPVGWDLADEVPEGLSVERMLNAAEPVDLAAARPLQALSIAELLERLVFHAETLRFIDKISHYPYEFPMIDALYRHREEGRKRISQTLLESPNLVKVHRLTYRPGQVEHIVSDEHGNLLFNTWRGPGIVAVEGNGAILENHLRYLCPTDAEFEFLANMLAFMVQKPGQKMRFALVLIGREGTGKSAIGQLMRKILGSQNMTEAFTSEIRSEFNEWVAEKELVIVEEIMAQGRIEIMNVLKPLITQDRIAINKKYVRRYEIENAANFIFLTNHKNALHIAPGDRRYFIVDSDAEPKAQAYYNELFKWIDENPGVALHWLKSRDISGFNPNERPPMTKGKEHMIEMSKDPREALIGGLIDLGEFPFDQNLIVSKEVHPILTGPSGLAKGMGLTFPVLCQILTRLGAVNLGQQNGKINGQLDRPSLWAIRDVDRYRNMSQQKIVEEHRGISPQLLKPNG